MKRIHLVIAGTALVALSACQQPTTMTQREANCAIGTVGGVAAGALIGRQVGKGLGRDLATVAGATGGGLAGASALCQ